MRNVQCINENWIFVKDTTNVFGANVPNGEQVNLPHTWNGVDGQDGGDDYFRGTCCYWKKISKSMLPEAEQYYLEICGANSSADVYVNGVKLAHHDGGYSTWRVDMTDAFVKDCDEQVIEVFVDNRPNDFVYPQNADFTFYGGLYRNVAIIAVSSTHFDLDYYGGKGLKITPVMEGCDAQVEVEVFVTNLKETDEICYTLLDREGNCVAKTQSKELKMNVVLENAHLWNGLKDAYLYRVNVEIVRNGCVIDNVSDRFGCRSFEIDPERGFILNGVEYPLRGVCRHQDRRFIGNALLPEHHVEDMDLICEMGANTIRLAHYQHDQYFYDLCDERGLVIWAEIPYISQQLKNGVENTISQMKELIVQNYNHPSIFVWGISNEIVLYEQQSEAVLENHRILNDMTRQMDPTRKTVVASCGWVQSYVFLHDAVSYNIYFGWYSNVPTAVGPWLDAFHAKYPNVPLGLSEYGCEALNWHTSNPTRGDYTEEYQAYYHEELIKQIMPRKYLWATHVWNMFDFGADKRAEGGENGQNHKGLVTMDRTYKKDSFYAYKAWWSDEPFVHINGKMYVERVEDMTKVTVYSNQPEVELYVNGTSIGKKTSEDHFFYFEVPNEKETVLVAVAGDCTDESYIRKVEEMNPDYVLAERKSVKNWFE